LETVFSALAALERAFSEQTSDEIDRAMEGELPGAVWQVTQRVHPARCPGPFPRQRFLFNQQLITDRLICAPGSI
jgi:hypothetical protein